MPSPTPTSRNLQCSACRSLFRHGFGATGTPYDQLNLNIRTRGPDRRPTARAFPRPLTITLTPIVKVRGPTIKAQNQKERSLGEIADGAACERKCDPFSAIVSRLLVSTTNCQT